MEKNRQHDLFVSYASVDRQRVLEIVDQLERLGLAIWIDKTGIAGGAAYGAEIAEAIKIARAIALMSSAASLASKNVRQEIMLGWRYETPMVPLLLEAVEPPDDVAYWLEGFAWIDARGDAEQWLPALIRRLTQYEVEIDLPDDLALADASAMPVAAGNLPSTEGELYGRQQVLQEVVSLLEHGRWLTLTGSGGTGKTRLAIEAGRRQSGVYLGGVWFVDLSPVSAVDQILPAVADALALESQGDIDFAELIGDALAGQKTLLILDNFEHVAPGAVDIAQLQGHLPELDVLATSRMPLRTEAEWAVEIPQLTLPDASANLPAAELARNPAVALFVERATRANAAFALTDVNARAIAEICARLEGLPLAIELSAARVRLLPPQVLLARLGSRLTLLSRAGGPTGRQRTLHETIAWSYDLLTPEQQQVFRRLGVLRGPSTMNAAISIAGDGSCDGDIATLVDHSLLKQMPPAPDDEPRVAMLETIREFALLLLDQEGEAETIQDRHAQFFSTHAGGFVEEIAKSGPGRALASLRADDANLHAAIDWLAASGSAREAIGMLTNLYSYWVRTGRSLEAARRLGEVMDLSPDLPPTLESRAALDLGRYAAMSGEAESAKKSFERALSLSTTSEDRVRQGHVLFELARSAERLGDLDAAAAHYEDAASAYGTAGLQREQAEAHHSLGVLHIYRGDIGEAVKAITESVEEFRKLADLRMVGEALSDLGSAEMLVGNSTAALKHFQDGLAIFRTLDDATAIAVLTTNLGRGLQISGDVDGARATLTEALQLTRKVGDRGNEAVTLYGLGLLERATDQRTRAAQMLRQALELAWANEDLWLVVEILEAIAHQLIDDGEVERATVIYGAASAVREESGTSVNPSEQEAFDRSIHQARESLGQERFESLFASGSSAAIDGVVQDLLGDRSQGT